MSDREIKKNMDSEMQFESPEERQMKEQREAEIHEKKIKLQLSQPDESQRDKSTEDEGMITSIKKIVNGNRALDYIKLSKGQI